jgi:SpoIID/LytB domain protein
MGRTVLHVQTTLYGAVTLCLCAAISAPSATFARPFEGLSRRDQMALLYKPQFQFTRDGEPLVSVGLSTAGTEATFGGPQGAKLLPAGEDGVELPIAASERVRVRVAKATPARIHHWVAERMLGADARLTAKHLSAWEALGFKPRPFDVGGVLGLEGRLLDNRVTIIGVERFESAAAAKSALARIARRRRAKLVVYEELRDPPAGVLEVVDAAGHVRARVRDLLWVVPAAGEVVELDGRPYRGTLYATLDAAGKLAVANSLASEQMLRGIVPAEIFPSAPEEALRAQAVTARGEILAKIGTRHFGEPYRVCARQHCQVYKGVSREHARADRAIAATRGEVLWGDDRLVDTVYSASCGGHTEHNELVWDSRKDPHLRGRPDHAGRAADLRDEETLRRFLAKKSGAHCARVRVGRGSRYRWTRRFSQAEVRSLVERKRAIGAIRAIEPLGRGVSGRVTGVRIIGTSGTLVVRREYPVRKLFGGLFSGLFVVDAGGAGDSGTPAAFTFRGGGWGHGVGMCQTGAMGMAQNGSTYREILKHYYRGGKVQKLY